MSKKKTCKLCGEYADSRIEMRKHIMNQHDMNERFDALHEERLVEDSRG